MAPPSPRSPIPSVPLAFKTFNGNTTNCPILPLHSGHSLVLHRRQPFRAALNRLPNRLVRLIRGWMNCSSTSRMCLIAATTYEFRIWSPSQQ